MTRKWPQRELLFVTSSDARKVFVLLFAFCSVVSFICGGNVGRFVLKYHHCEQSDQYFKTWLWNGANLHSGAKCDCRCCYCVRSIIGLEDVCYVMWRGYSSSLSRWLFKSFPANINTVLIYWVCLCECSSVCRLVSCHVCASRKPHIYRLQSDNRVSQNHFCAAWQSVSWLI